MVIPHLKPEGLLHPVALSSQIGGPVSFGATPRRTVVTSCLPDPAAIVAAIRAITEAEEPVLLLGSDMFDDAAAELLRNFSTTTGIALHRATSETRASLGLKRADLLIEVASRGRQHVLSFRSGAFDKSFLSLTGNLAKILRGLEAGLSGKRRN